MEVNVLIKSEKINEMKTDGEPIICHYVAKFLLIVSKSRKARMVLASLFIYLPKQCLNHKSKNNSLWDRQNK